MEFEEKRPPAMSAIDHVKEFDRNLRPRERHFGFSRIALRRRSADHPMIMFFIIVATAFAAMMLVPPSGSVFASLGVSSAVAEPSVETHATASAGGLSEIEIACSGQAWGAENADCLAVIAKESGSHMRKIRVIANAEPQTAIPNVF
jgi:hypothetical protein